jgi:hypothetical protein
MVALFFVVMIFPFGLQIFQVLVQPVQTAFPEPAVLFHPIGHLFHRLGLQFQRMHPATTPAPDQPRPFQDAQMLGNRRQRHRIRPGQIRHAPVTARQMLQNTPPRGISERRKSVIQRPRQTFNHMVNYNRKLKNFASEILQAQRREEKLDRMTEWAELNPDLLSRLF